MIDDIKFAQRLDEGKEDEAAILSIAKDYFSMSAYYYAIDTKTRFNLPDIYGFKERQNDAEHGDMAIISRRTGEVVEIDVKGRALSLCSMIRFNGEAYVITNNDESIVLYKYFLGDLFKKYKSIGKILQQGIELPSGDFGFRFEFLKSKFPEAPTFENWLEQRFPY